MSAIFGIDKLDTNRAVTKINESNKREGNHYLVLYRLFGSTETFVSFVSMFLIRCFKPLQLHSNSQSIKQTNGFFSRNLEVHGKFRLKGFWHKRQCITFFTAIDTFYGCGGGVFYFDHLSH